MSSMRHGNLSAVGLQRAIGENLVGIIELRIPLDVAQHSEMISPTIPI
ncbi:hypothetical protein [Bradyrhizobium sp. DASA03007]